LLGSSAKYNVFYHNNFINNAQQEYIETPSYANSWDDGYPSGGNYWSDYARVDLHSGTYQNATGIDGIGDLPYVIDVNNADRYPLMHSFDPQTEDMKIAIRNLLLEYNSLRSDFEELNSTYYDLLNGYAALLSNTSQLTEECSALNASYHQHLQDYNNLLANDTSLNSALNSLQSNYNSLNSSYDELRTKLEATTNEANNLQNQTYALIAATAVLVVAIVFLAIRKPKTR
jgi:uncharacterized phage infection (PIP) family protein YhgE